MRRHIYLAMVATLLASCANQPVPESQPAQTVRVSSILDENAQLRAENERLRQTSTITDYEMSRIRARDARRMSDMKVFVSAANVYAVGHKDQLPRLGDDEFQNLMVANRVLVEAVAPPSAGEHYCLAFSPERTDYAFSTWLEEGARVAAVTSERANGLVDPAFKQASRDAYFGSACPAVPGWTSVRL
jgi:hypothetical protein